METETREIETTPTGSRRPLDSVPNFRDVGGLETADGRRVRTGLLFRSGSLDRLDGADSSEFDRFGIRTIFDLRTETERVDRPDQLPAEARYVVADVVGTEARHAPGRLMETYRNPELAHEVFGDGRGRTMFTAHYREFVSLESAREAYGRVFKDLIDERNRPALIHCLGGKDRTGWTTASLLLLLRVPESLVMADFLASNDNLRSMFESLFGDFEARGGDPDLIADLFWVSPEYLEAAVDEMCSRYGTVENYFAEGLAIGNSGLHALRDAFLHGPTVPRGGRATPGRSVPRAQLAKRGPRRTTLEADIRANQFRPWAPKRWAGPKTVQAQ